MATRSASLTASTMTRHFAARRGFVERRRDLGRPRRDAGMRDEPDGPPALPGEPAADVGIGHRVERMRAQARLAEQPVADEQMTLIDRAAGGRKGRACRNPGDAEGLGERLADRTDIAGRRRIEGRAVFEDELAAALRAQPIEGGERLGDGLGRGDRAALQRHHAGIATRRRRPRRDAEELRRREPPAVASARERVGDVARAREIIRDDAEQHGRSTRRQDQVLQLGDRGLGCKRRSALCGLGGETLVRAPMPCPKRCHARLHPLISVSSMPNRRCRRSPRRLRYA